MDGENMGKFGFRSGKVKLKEIESNFGPSVYFGSNTTRATVLAEYPLAKVGSLYASTAGKLYLRVAVAGAETDWQKVTASAAD